MLIKSCMNSSESCWVPRGKYVSWACRKNWTNISGVRSAFSSSWKVSDSAFVILLSACSFWIDSSLPFLPLWIFWLTYSTQGCFWEVELLNSCSKCFRHLLGHISEELGNFLQPTFSTIPLFMYSSSTIFQLLFP